VWLVMSNHYHLVLKLCPKQIESLSDDDIVDRWCALFKGPLLIQRYRDGESLRSFERNGVSDIVNVWRSKLASISWFMRCLNQPIAHQANREDQCTGKFWESRFTSQALKSDEALLSCMTYVDLNPVRAGIADTPETSSHTSIRERLQPEFDLQQAIDDQTQCGDLLNFKMDLKPLLHFENRMVNEPQRGILFNFEEYMNLVDWTSRIIRSDKRGYIDSALPPILVRLKIAPDQWRINTTQFEAIHPKRFNRPISQLDTG
jgi:REP element-mobilizing transposase RayT